MRERLLANLRKLPQIVETWNAAEDNDLQPSQFARHVTKVCYCLLLFRLKCCESLLDIIDKVSFLNSWET